jgi:hypothetical protein
MTHTPGPWIADHSGYGDATVTAKCGWLNKDGSKFEPTIIKRTSWKDARIIAAAPEMLEAMKLALELQEGVENTKPDGYGTPGNTLTWMDWFRQIIAKAEGR